MCRDVEGGEDVSIAAAYWHCQRSQAGLEFFLDQAPSLLGHDVQFCAQCIRAHERALGPGFENRVRKPFFAQVAAQRREKVAPRECAMAGKRASDTERCGDSLISI